MRQNIFKYSEEHKVLLKLELQAQACELQTQLISSSREEFSKKIDFSLNSTIIFNLDLIVNCSFK
jgi:hypothetical protein